ncbi:MAG: hypothetical protein R2755_30815 [Acidimicrobiales bacterium]
MPSARLMALHLVAEQKMFWRNPPAAVFTFVFPLIFLAIFPSLMAGEVVGAPVGRCRSSSTSCPTWPPSA